MFQKMSFHFKKILVVTLCSGAALAAVGALKTKQHHRVKSSSEEICDSKGVLCVTFTQTPARSGSDPDCTGSTADGTEQCSVTFTLKGKNGRGVQGINPYPSLDSLDGWNRSPGNIPNIPTNGSQTQTYTFKPTKAISETTVPVGFTCTGCDNSGGRIAFHLKYSAMLKASVTSSFSPNSVTDSVVDTPKNVTLTFTTSTGGVTNLVPQQLDPAFSNDGWKLNPAEQTCPSMNAPNSSCSIHLTFTPTAVIAPSKNFHVTFKYTANGKELDPPAQTVDLPYAAKSKETVSITSTFTGSCENILVGNSCPVTLSFTTTAGDDIVTNLKPVIQNSKFTGDGWSQPTPASCSKVTADPNSCTFNLTFKPTNVVIGNLALQFTYTTPSGEQGPETTATTFSYSSQKPSGITTKFVQCDANWNNCADITKLTANEFVENIKAVVTNNTAVSLTGFNGPRFQDNDNPPDGWVRDEQECRGNTTIAPDQSCAIRFTFATKRMLPDESDQILQLIYSYTGSGGALPVVPLSYRSNINITRWKTDDLGPVMSNPVMNNDLIFVGTNNAQTKVGVIQKIQDNHTDQNGEPFTITPLPLNGGTFCEGASPSCYTTPLLVLNNNAIKFLYTSTNAGVSIFDFTQSGQGETQVIPNEMPPQARMPTPTNVVSIGDTIYRASSNKISGYSPDGKTLKFGPYAATAEGALVLPDLASAEQKTDEGDDPLFAASNKIYYGTSDGQLHGVNSSNFCPVLLSPIVLTTAPSNDFPLSSPTVDSNGNIYIGYSHGKDDSSGGTFSVGKLSKITPDGTKTDIFTCPTRLLGGDKGCKIIAKPVIGPDGTIYVGTYDGGHSVYGIDPKAADGSLKFLWKFETGGDIVASPVPINIGTDDKTNIILFATSKNGTLYALDPKKYNKDDNKAMELWEYPMGTGHGSYTSPVVDTVNHTVYFGDVYNGLTQGFVYALDYSKAPMPTAP